MRTHSISAQTPLTCHADSYSGAIEGIQVYVGWAQSDALALTYALTGDLMRLRLPPPQTPRRADRLWEHTCFEAFVSVKGSPEYYEFNFASSGEWAVYGFQRYREGMPLEDDRLAPKITVHHVTRGLDLEAIVQLDRLAAIPPRARLRLGLAAVIEEKNGRLSYWGLKHPPGRPDFHHPDAFALELDLPAAEAANESTLEKR
jgi:hypothetical protein